MNRKVNIDIFLLDMLKIDFTLKTLFPSFFNPFPENVILHNLGGNSPPISASKVFSVGAET